MKIVEPLEVKENIFSAIILSGGQARRMGGCQKALLGFLGKPMINYALTVLEGMPTKFQQILINTNSSDGYQVYGYPLVKDNLLGSLGPLAGVEAGLSYIKEGYLLVLPCDVPMVKSVVIQRLITAVIDGDSCCAVAHDGERMQSTFAIFHKSQASSLKSYLEGGGRRLITWYKQQNITEVPCADIKEVFSNINTESDLQQAEALYKASIS